MTQFDNKSEDILMSKTMNHRCMHSKASVDITNFMKSQPQNIPNNHLKYLDSMLTIYFVAFYLKHRPKITMKNLKK